eukprot:TRINITY_DN2065_c0_g1_i1.p1 TRINITY_DN2065_c0_g1~~TRINITY_DN2065_c0_g1_i1.p1  ORF type:complete len:219 (-),score=13.70 TRINITY_DN2065_c0_g1_i1:112-768(-)
MGYTPAPLRVLNGKENDVARMEKNIRDAHRVLYHCPDDVVNPVDDRIRNFLPQETEIKHTQLSSSRWKVCHHCINERWRFGRYSAGQYFLPHFDAGFNRSQNEKSLFTFIIYLNDGFDGGETIFFPEGKPRQWSKPNEVKEVVIKPKAGTALVFYHVGRMSPRHEGAKHTASDSYKYIIRSDLMYKQIPSKKSEEKEVVTSNVNETVKPKASSWCTQS